MPEIPTSSLQVGQMGFSGAQRSFAKLADNDTVSVETVRFGANDFLGAIELGMEFQKKKFSTKERYDVTALSNAFVSTFGT